MDELIETEYMQIAEKLTLEPIRVIREQEMKMKEWFCGSEESCRKAYQMTKSTSQTDGIRINMSVAFISWKGLGLTFDRFLE